MKNGRETIINIQYEKAAKRHLNDGGTFYFGAVELKLFIEDVVCATTKAFGDCVKCYGKGYGTQTLYARGRGESDMGQGDVVVDEKLPTMVFCTCDRGKQLSRLIEDNQKKHETIRGSMER